MTMSNEAVRETPEPRTPLEDPIEKLRRTLSDKPVIALVVACCLVFGGYKAVTSLNEHAQLTTAKVRCVAFAKEREVFPKGHEVEAMDAWTKHDGRYAVVALGNAGSKPFQSEICVRSSYSIHIVSRLHEPFWY